MKHLEYKIHDVKDSKITVTTFSFGSWHLNEVKEALKKDKTRIIACLWDFMERIEIDKQYLQYMGSRGFPPKEWVGRLPKMNLTEDGFLIKEEK